MKKYDHIYFIGIGGIGMSAIARYYKFKGLDVSGYDRTPSDLTHAFHKRIGQQVLWGKTLRKIADSLELVATSTEFLYLCLYRFRTCNDITPAYHTANHVMFLGQSQQNL